MLDVNAHLAATDTPNNIFTRTAVRVLYPPVRVGIQIYFGLGVMLGSSRVSMQFVNLINERMEAAAE